MPKSGDESPGFHGLPFPLTPRRVARLREVAAQDHSGEQAVLQALADHRRLKVLYALSGGELCACVLVELLGVKPSALSYHLSRLAETGLVRAKRDGNFQVYALTPRGRSALQLARKMAR